MTDTEGRFRVDCPYDLEDRIEASKSGYVYAPVPTGWGDSLDGPSGNRICREIVLELLAEATVSGDVFYANGARAPGALVTLQVLKGHASTVKETTDQNGHFRLQAAPGGYSLCAVPEYQVHRSWKVPEHAPSTIPVAACFTTAAGGPAAAVLALKQADVVGPLRVRLGEERAFSIRGRIEIEVPKTIDWWEGIWAIPQPLVAYSSLEGRITPQGRFLIEGLRAGSYMVVARSGRAPRCDTCPGGPLFQDLQRVEVHQNVKALVMRIRPNGVVTGRVVVEGGKADQREKRMVYLQGDLPPESSLYTRAEADAEGRFRIGDVPPGSYRVEAQERHKEYVAAIRQDGRALAGDRIQIESGRSTDLEITVQRNTALIEITPLGDRGAWPDSPLSIAIPENGWDDPYSWILAGGDTHTLPKLGPLPPGTYFVMVTQYSGGDPPKDQVSLHRQEAVRVVLKDGETAKVAVKPILLVAE